jgi:hypothetical protein
MYSKIKECLSSSSDCLDVNKQKHLPLIAQARSALRIATRSTIGVRRGVSKRVEDGRRLPALQAGHPRNGRVVISGVARPQGIEGLGMADPSDALGSPWPPLAIRLRAARYAKRFLR